MLNILTVDLEDWFVVENLKENIDSQEWEKLPSRMEKTTEKLLDLFDTYGVRATFFVLGWIAEKYPRLINEIAVLGHEIGCHSYRHRRVDTMTPQEFKEDTKRAIDIIAEASGSLPIGYRAPSWSINSRVMWAYDILAELGFMYDSSVYPIKHDIYGEPDGPRTIFRLKTKSGKKIYEIPASTVSIMGKNFPVGGGGYLRHSPLWFTTKMIKKLNEHNLPAIVYIHPWEFDENQPRLQGVSWLQKYRQYGSTSTLIKKMEILLDSFDFCPAADYIKNIVRKPIGFGRE